jgi:hypothetical protein
LQGDRPPPRGSHFRLGYLGYLGYLDWPR